MELTANATAPFQGVITPTWRFEFKYRIPMHTYHRIRAMALLEMRLDAYSSRAPQGRYHVQSLYFDTYENRLFREKQAGDTSRIKLRIRTYAENPPLTDRVKYEIKMRTGDASGKIVGIGPNIPPRRIISRCGPGENLDPAVAEFIRQVQIQQLEPKVLTRYEREAYVTRSDDSVRVTFDHAVRSTYAHRLGEPGAFTRMHHRGWVVMEVKTLEEQPHWISRIVRDLGLKALANSKFTQAILASRPELHHSTGIVSVR
jgi:hypothetical protein